MYTMSPYRQRQAEDLPPRIQDEVVLDHSPCMSFVGQDDEDHDGNSGLVEAQQYGVQDQMSRIPAGLAGKASRLTPQHVSLSRSSFSASHDGSVLQDQPSLVSEERHESPLFSLLQGRLSASRAYRGVCHDSSNTPSPNDGGRIQAMRDEIREEDPELSANGPKTSTQYEHTSARCSNIVRRQNVDRITEYNTNSAPSSSSLRDLFVAHRARQQERQQLQPTHHQQQQQQ
eukprot:scpid94658/ scgid22806/ 